MSNHASSRLRLAVVLVVIAAALPGCRHAFECRGEITPTLPAWSAVERPAQPAPQPAKE